MKSNNSKRRNNCCGSVLFFVHLECHERYQKNIEVHNQNTFSINVLFIRGKGGGGILLIVCIFFMELLVYYLWDYLKIN
jgi:hypothetical protein